MSDMTNRQAYVFLQDGDVLQKGDQFLNVETDEYEDDDGNIGHIFKRVRCSHVRRPITLPTEQADKLTVWDEYFLKAIEVTYVKEGVSYKDDIEAAIRLTKEMMKARAGK